MPHNARQRQRELLGSESVPQYDHQLCVTRPQTGCDTTWNSRFTSLDASAARIRIKLHSKPVMITSERDLVLSVLNNMLNNERATCMS